MGNKSRGQILGLAHMFMQDLESSRLLASTMEVLTPQGPLQRAQLMTWARKAAQMTQASKQGCCFVIGVLTLAC